MGITEVSVDAQLKSAEIRAARNGEVVGPASRKIGGFRNAEMKLGLDRQRAETQIQDSDRAS